MEKDKNLRNELLDTKAHPVETKSIPERGDKGDRKDVSPHRCKKSDILERGHSEFDQTQGNLSSKLIKIHSVKIVSVYRADGYRDSGTDQKLRDRRYIYPNCGNNLEINNTQINPWGAFYRNSIINIKKIGTRKTSSNASGEHKINNWGRLQDRDSQNTTLERDQSKNCSDEDFILNIENRCTFCNLAKYKAQLMEPAYNEKKHIKTSYNNPSIEEIEDLRADTSDPAAVIKYHEAGDIEAQK